MSPMGKITPIYNLVARRKMCTCYGRPTFAEFIADFEFAKSLFATCSAGLNGAPACYALHVVHNDPYCLH